MSNLARIQIYIPQLLFFEMQQFRQEYVCWFSGPYNTRRVKFSNSQPLTLWKNKLQFKKSFVEKGASFYKTASNRNLRSLNQTISLLHIYLNHWMMGALVGFQNSLRLRGVGYRFDVSSLKMTIQVGYSHLISKKFPSPKFLQTSVVNKKSTLLKIKSSNLVFLQTFLSNVRASRRPDVYKGKGIRYQKEFIFRKEGKKKKTS